MGNNYAAPQTLPDPNEVGTGQVLRASTVQTLAESVNHAWAHHKCHPVIAQSWPGGQCTRTNAAFARVAFWRVPYVSKAHLTWEIRVYGSSSGGTGIVQFGHPKSGVVQNQLLPAAAAWVTVPDFTGVHGLAGGVPEGLDVIEMELRGTSAQVQTVVVQPKALTSPLATTAYDDFLPMGVNINAADHPLPSGRGKTIVDDVNEMLAQRRVLFNWSGLANVDGTQDAVMPNHLHSAWNALHTGALRRGVQYTVDAYCQPDGVNDEYVRVMLSRTGRRQAFAANGASQVLVAGGGGAGWFSKSFQIPDEDRAAPEFPASNTYVGFEYGTDYPSQTTADIQSVAIWGE